MTQPPGTQASQRRIPFSDDEKARGEANLAPYVAQMVAARGRFTVTADSPDQIELFQRVARRVSDMLGRPVASYANGRDIVIALRTGSELVAEPVQDQFGPHDPVLG